MANETIDGCVTWPGGVVTFSQDSCEYTGCIIWTGEHAGQIQVIINNINCDDTYYGCIDWTTGKFQLVIPDTCCACCTYCECSYSGNDSNCFPVNETPLKLCVTFSGIRRCSDNSLWADGLTICLEQSVSDVNKWDKSWAYGGENLKVFLDARSGGQSYLYIQEDDIPPAFGYFFDENYGCDDIQGWTGGCELMTYPNQRLIGNCSGFNKGYGGTGLLRNPCKTL